MYTIFSIKKIIFFFLTVFLGSNSILQAQQNYQPTKENLEARQWFQDAKFGLFIHWGVYSLLGGAGEKGIAEWVMHNKKISLKDYEKLPPYFNPISFNAQEWVKTAKDAGIKYITITTKHHDGFAMYDSKVSNYNIVNSTPYGKDILKQLAEECKEQGIKLFFYHSHLDWHHPDYFPRGNTGQANGRPESGNWNNYLTYMNTQLTELLTNYGNVAGIWFDGMWDKKDADWQLDKTYSLIHKLQPAALIGNNHHLTPFPGEDFQMFEKDLPGQNLSGHSATSVIGKLPLETCETMNGSWGFNLVDNNFKSTKTLIQYLVKAAGHNANFLLNTGPMPNGKIQPENVKTLKEIGDWLKKNGETVYGTRGGPIAAHSWGVTTAKGSKVYVHIMDLQDPTLALPIMAKKVKAARLFADKSKVQFTQNDYGVLLKVPAAKRNAIDTIIELEL